MTKATLLLSAALLPALAAQAQTTFSIGPRLGLNVAGTTTYRDNYDNRDVASGSRVGAELGVVANVGFGHFAVQPALLYSQKGFTLNDTYSVAEPRVQNTRTVSYDDQYRLNYLLLPLNLVYSLAADGQGPQFFAGPYLGKLLGGTYAYNQKFTNSGPSSPTTTGTEQRSGEVGIGDVRTTNNPNNQYFSRSLDAGLQAGLGYRLGGLLLQVSYSQGLRNLGSDFFTDYGRGFGTKSFPGPTFKSRSVQASVSYLFGGK